MNKDPNPESESSQNIPTFVNKRDEIQAVLSHLFDVIFPVAITIGAVALLFSIYRSFNNGWFFTLFLHVSIYVFAVGALIFRHKISPRLLFYFLLGLMYLSIIHSFYILGFAGEGMITMVMLCIFTGVFLGTRAGIIAMTTGVLIISVMGYLICGGLIHSGPDMVGNFVEPVTWIIQILMALLYVIPLILIINYMRKRIIESLAVSRGMNAKLQDEIKTRIVVEKNLRESEEKYKGVVENSLVAFYIIQDGFFRFVNTRFCDITGYAYDEIVGTMSPFDLIHPDDRKKVEKFMKDFLQDKTDENEYDLKMIKKNGKTITVKVLRNKISYNGRPAYFGTAVDVTKEKALEAKLTQAEKMEAIGTLAGGIAHDFNNILTALIGYGTILQMKIQGTDPLRRYADQILSASEKAINLTQSLLTFSRLQPVALKSVNINRAIQGTEKLLRRLITEDIRLETVLAPEQINILADSTQIDQILFNLVTNARDALPAGGVLKISTKKIELDDEFIRINGFGKKGRYALLAVSDNGIGMDEKTKNRIFDPFFTTKDIGKGTGLGLSTVYGIVKQNHGYITVHSEPEKGTDFHIYIPLLTNDVFDTDKTTVKLREGSETILVAEDNDEARSFIKDILEQYGYRVVEAADGNEAIKKFKDNEGIPLVILDCIMPKKNGREAYSAIKGIQPEVLTLFISGYSQEVLLAKGMIEPGIEFISKPFTPDELLKKVGELLDRQV